MNNDWLDLWSQRGERRAYTGNTVLKEIRLVRQRRYIMQLTG